MGALYERIREAEKDSDYWPDDDASNKLHALHEALDRVREAWIDRLPARLSREGPILYRLNIPRVKALLRELAEAADALPIGSDGPSKGEEQVSIAPAAPPEGNQAHEGSAETTMTPGARALAAAYHLSREGKRVSVKAAAELAGVDRSHLIKKYPEAVAAIKKLGAPDHAPPRGEKGGGTGTMEAWEDE
jgi:hypothetical protein